MTPTDLRALLSHLPECGAIVTTGQKATEQLLQHFHAPLPAIGHYVEAYEGNRSLRLYRMPSSSRAYPLALDKKAAFYRHMFLEVLGEI